ncbi:uncharacterized protein JN550_010766 [Neoarthrinium moseri]|uniref:uncharacterized protein n=1 Tax=Neoarthrinium moseri TaxID=1658444 RepID=UPI001FDE414D|nr:uncharacterized protein JN550_010766 [Neoarthrinium moseri]KAI1861696.1 hypothetical protein JN550_010766 [Neoarthrinium moseri]
MASGFYGLWVVFPAVPAGTLRVPAWTFRKRPRGQPRICSEPAVGAAQNSNSPEGPGKLASNSGEAGAVGCTAKVHGRFLDGVIIRWGGSWGGVAPRRANDQRPSLGLSAAKRGGMTPLYAL